MKKMTCVVLMLCIAMMCTTPFEAQSQNRRTGGGNSGNATKKEQPVRSSGSSATTTRSNEPKTKMATPSGQTNRSSHTNHSAQTATRQSAPKAQVQDRRSNGTVHQNGNNHSSQISRKNSEVGRQNIPSGHNRPSGNNKPSGNVKPSGNHGYNDPIYRNNGNHKPNAVQYHNHAPAKRAPNYSRPYLEPKHTPMPSYRYGNHYFGHRIHSLPRGYVTMRVGGLDYYYYDGIYYRPYRAGGYYICRPPRGTTIASTLFNVALTAIAINTIRNEIDRAQRAAELSRIYANRNTGYVVRTRDDYYNTNLASQAGQDYYYQDGVFYILQNGQYYVIEAPIGALVTEIPADYDEIELDGETFYLVENTLYKVTVIDGALYFEVVSNL